MSTSTTFVTYCSPKKLELNIDSNGRGLENEKFKNGFSKKRFFFGLGLGCVILGTELNLGHKWIPNQSGGHPCYESRRIDTRNGFMYITFVKDGVSLGEHGFEISFGQVSFSLHHNVHLTLFIYLLSGLVLVYLIFLK